MLRREKARRASQLLFDISPAWIEHRDCQFARRTIIHHSNVEPPTDPDIAEVGFVVTIMNLSKTRIISELYTDLERYWETEGESCCRGPRTYPSKGRKTLITNAVAEYVRKLDL